MGNFIYDQLLRRRPHFLFDLSRAVDFSFVKAALKDFYVDWGRDPWDPVLMFKMVFLQFLYDLSDRDIEEQCTWNLLFKSFLGLSAEELPPGHTALCRFRQRLGVEGFQKLFNQVVEQARAQGLVSDRLHIIDATHMIAKVDLFRLKKGHRDGDDDDHYVDRKSPDPDARFGRKSSKKGFYGYKSHMVQDADSEFLVQAGTTPGNVPDGAVFPQVAQHPLCVDGILDRLLIGIKDLSESEHIREQALQLEQRALLGEVMAIFTHEVRNPINNISTGLQWMASDLSPEDPHQAEINGLLQDCDRLVELMKSVLSFSKSANYIFQPVDLTLMFQRLINQRISRLQTAKISYDIQVPPGIPDVQGDVRALEQVFTNLINNRCKP